MRYRLELNIGNGNSNLIFNNIYFDSFKTHIIERYTFSRRDQPQLHQLVIKVRTLDDDLIETTNGNKKVKIKADDLIIYKNLSDKLKTYEYKNNLINRKDIEQDYINLILKIVISNYRLY